MDDARLALRARDGDREAFRTLLEGHYDMVFRVACRILGHAADAEDVTQEVCVSLPRRLQTFRGESRFSTWLYRVTVNACRDFARRRASADSVQSAYVEVSAMMAADAAEEGRLAGWLEETLATLDEALRETAVLVLGEELSHAEAAGILGIKESTVSWRMHELRKKLKALAGTYHDG